MNVTLPEADCATIQRGRHYWPAGSPRPMTLAEVLEVKMKCGSARYVEVKGREGNLYDRMMGRELLVREPVTEKPKKIKSPKRPGVATRHGALLLQAMSSRATEGLVHARAAD